MFRYFIGCLLVLTALRATAQGEGSMWAITGNHTLSFAVSPPILGTPPFTIGNLECAAAVCYPNGTIRFWVDLRYDQTDMVLRATGIPVPGSNLLSDHNNNSTNNKAKPVIVQRPGNPNQFYIFHSKGGALFYSLLDMSSGGAILQKDIMVSPYGTIVPARVVAVRGCDCIWLVARMMNGNRYASFRIDQVGLNATPVLSIAGLMTRYYGEYEAGNSAMMEAANDGSQIAACGAYGAGVEVYDFEKCSGKLLNARLIDTSGNPSPSVSGERVIYSGLCFSNNNRFLYIAKSHPLTTDSIANGIAYEGRHGQVLQFDVQLPSHVATIASKVMVMQNPYIMRLNFLTCNIAHSPEIRDIKMGPDGKIYVHNNVQWNSCNASFNPLFSVGPAFHTIVQPNNQGLLCQPNYNVIPTGFIQTYQLPNELVTSSILTDTLKGSPITLTVCFSDSVQLKVDTAAICPKWYDGIVGRTRVVTAPGRYFVSYFGDGCTYRTDTFLVRFVRFPKIIDSQYSCPGSFAGKASVNVGSGDTTKFTFIWKTGDGAILRTAIATSVDSISNLDTGRSLLTIRTSSGCDTTISIYVSPLPKPKASIDIDTNICKGEPVDFTATTDAPKMGWSFNDGKSFIQEKKVSHTFSQTGKSRVILVVQNIEGCTDTVEKLLLVHDLSLSVSADRNRVDIGEQVTLFASANESFQVLAWLPVSNFPSQSSKVNTTRVDSTTVFLVVGTSSYGCTDTALVEIAVNPVIFIPSAFSPNGDGKNDWFRVRSAGSMVRVKKMEIFNRWGNLLFSGYNQVAEKGWNGTCNDKACDLGTYFYTVLVESAEGKTFYQKGDVTLVR